MSSKARSGSMSGHINHPNGIILDELRYSLRIKEFFKEELSGAIVKDGGGRSDIYFAEIQDYNPRFIAIKIYTMSFHNEATKSPERREKLLGYYRREFKFWKELDEHPNIVRLLGFVDGFANSSLPGLVSEFYDKGNLRNLVNDDPSLPRLTRLQLLLDAAQGLAFIQNQKSKLCHRDIRGVNIFVKRDAERGLVAALGDFGSAKAGYTTSFFIEASTLRYSLDWVPPEYLRGDGDIDFSKPTQHGDIWSFGCTFLEIMTGQDPWGSCASVKDRLLGLNASEPHHPSRPDGFPKNYWNFLQSCWWLVPRDRIHGSVVVCWLERFVKAEESSAQSESA
ncbi:hypothetical protein M0805_007961 [Coniferiporia weirii]|nr:hypothetical protein M0805_007961 [Coniferiporia weirii]